MRKTAGKFHPLCFVLFINSIILWPFVAFSRDSTQANHSYTILKADLVYPVISLVSPDFLEMVSAAVEKSTKKNQSFQLGIAYSNFKNYQTHLYSFFSYSISFGSYTVQKTLDVIPAYKFYIRGRNYYAGFYGKYTYTRNNTEIIQTDTNFSLPEMVFDLYWNAGSAGIIAGYQLLALKRVQVDVMGGFGIRKIFYNKIITLMGEPKSVVADAMLSVNIGYRFYPKNN